ncbi:MAG: hypothetical protein GY950_32295, partial [bacterium]|nr:hypothetical protein [bacterium]
GYAVAVDAGGSAYVTGHTNSFDFPTTNPIREELQGWADCFVAKLSPDGRELVYSSYIGGTGWESCKDIAVDDTGSAYITGDTDSIDFPVVNGIQANLKGWNDGFVLKLSPGGSEIVYSTYLGGSNWETTWGIALDAAGSAYVAGSTDSSDFPTQNPFQPALYGWGDAFVSKFSPDGGELVYSTYLGGNYYEDARSIAVDSEGSAYVTGGTYSTDFPLQNPFQEMNGWDDGFVTKFSPDGGTLVYSTYLGGLEYDYCTAIAVDTEGCAYVGGVTNSTDFPTVNPFQEAYRRGDGFVTKFSTDGSELVYSTYLGGNDWEEIMDITVDAGGCSYVVGSTYSTDFPIKNALKKELRFEQDGFITKFTPSGSDVVFSTYFGGSNVEACMGIAADNNGNAYVTGWTASHDFPIKNALKENLSALWDNDAFVAKIHSLVLNITAARHEERSWLIKKQYGKIEWSVENSGNIPISKFVLYRKAYGSASYLSLTEIPVSSQSVYEYTDLIPDKEKSYTYKVEALDDTGEVVGISEEVTI